MQWEESFRKVITVVINVDLGMTESRFQSERAADFNEDLNEDLNEDWPAALGVLKALRISVL